MRIRTTILLLLLSGTINVPDSIAQQPVTQELTLEGNRLGRMYEGWGTVFSYAKLLYDYPEKERNDILDMLFRPNYGASLQVLKVGIGYDGNSDESCWQANKRSADDPGNYRRGYGGWLIEEARKRNPEIRLAALHWGYPAWAVDDELKARFIYEYVKGTKDAYGHTIQYIGGNQNESKITPEVTKKLRRILNEGGFHDVKIIAADEGARVKTYSVIPALKNDKEYADVVDIIGIHFKGRPADSKILDKAWQFGKPIWSTEDSGGNYKYPASGYSTVDQFMKLFLDVGLTCAIRWLGPSSHYENMPWPAAGIIKANEPWSGHYKIGAVVWGIAHITQFIPVGWRMIETDDTYLRVPGLDKPIGRVATYKDPESSNYSIVIRTNNYDLPDIQKIRVILKNGLSGGTVSVWQSDFTEDPGQWFKKKGALHPSGNAYELELSPNKVYTLSTTTGQQKAVTRIPDPVAFPFPYREDFENYAPEELPRYFVNVNSSFEIASEGTNRILKQVVKDAPLQWHYKSRPVSQPMTIIGDMQWKDYAVSVKAMLKSSGRVLLGGRFDGKMKSSGDFEAEGYWLSLDEKGNWKLLRKDTTGEQFVELDAGKIKGFGLHKWAEMKMSFKGSAIEGYLNGTRVTQKTDSVHSNGNVGLALLHHKAPTFFDATSEYPVALYDDLMIGNP